MTGGTVIFLLLEKSGTKTILHSQEEYSNVVEGEENVYHLREESDGKRDKLLATTVR